MSEQSYERLEKVIEWTGLSTHAFAMKIGMKRSENLYRIMRNKENVSIKLAQLILETYPQISRNWFVYGEGDMFNPKEDEFEGCNKIPVYHKTLNKPITYFNIPILKDASFAISQSDKSMSPLIPDGSIIMLKEHRVDTIIYGNPYYIKTEMFSLARILRKCDTSDDKVILEAANNNHYDSITIDKKNIIELHSIRGVLTIFQ